VAISDDELIPPSRSTTEPGAKAVEVSPRPLPQVLDGVVVDGDGVAVKGATVTLRIYRAKDLFEKSPAEITEQWTASTNDDGVYQLSLGEQSLELNDDLMLQVRADGYLPLDSSLDFSQASRGTLPKQQLTGARKKLLIDSEDDPWNGWEDDTAAFNAETAAMVNGVAVLNGAVIDRYAGYLIGAREQMQEAARNPDPGKKIPTPKVYEEFRARLVLRELPAHIQQTILVQYLMARLTPEQRILLDRHVDVQFEKEIEKLQRELNVSNRTELEKELHNKGTKLRNVRDNFALARLAGECIAIHTKRLVPVSEREILQYYETHNDQFERPETVDWRQIGFRFSPGAGKARAQEDLEQIRNRLNQGEPFENVVQSFSNYEGFFSKSWDGTASGSLADRDLRAQLVSNPLNQWGQVIEQQPNSPASGLAVPDTVTESALPNVASSETEDPLKADNDIATKTTKVDTTSPLRFRHNLSQGFLQKSSPSYAAASVAKPSETSAGMKAVGRTASLFSQEIAMSVVCTTARHEPHRMPIEKVRDEIRETLTKEQDAKRTRKLMYKVFSTARIESFYSLPQFTNESLADSNEPGAADPMSPDEQTIQSMNGWEIDEAIEVLDRAILRNPNNAAHFRDRGYFWAHKRELDKAIIDYDEAIRLDSDNAMTRCERGIVLLTKLDFDRAFVDLDEAIRMDPKLALAYSNRGAAKVNQGLLEQGLVDLELAVQLKPIALNYVNRGIAYSKRGEIDKSLADFDEAIRLDDKCILAYQCRADIWTLKSDIYKVVEQLDYLLRLDPNNLPALRERGSRCTELGQIDKALADFDRAILLDKSGDADSFSRRAYLWTRKGEPAKAMADLDQAIRLNPNDRTSFYNRAGLHFNAKQREKALADIDELIRLDPSDVKAHILRGATLYGMGDYDQAVSSYNEAIRFDENNVNARIGRSDCWRRQRQYERAVEELNYLIRLDSNNADAILHRGYCWKALGQLDHALADFDDGIRLFQTPNADAYAARGRLMLAKGNLAKAIADMGEAIRIEPKHAENQNSLSWWLATSAEPQCRDGIRAVELATKACELSKWKNDSHIDTLAAALAEAGDFDQAQNRLQQAIDMAPESHTESRAKRMALFKDRKPYREEETAKSK